MNPAVLALVEDRKDYTAWWRCLWPFAELRKHGIRVASCLYSDLAAVDVQSFDIILTPRVTFGASHWLNRWLREQRKQGKRWLYDADDDLWADEFVERQIEMAQPHGRSERRKVRDKYQRQLEDRIATLRRCDGVTVANQHLAERARSYTGKPVLVVPNAIDTGWFETGFHGYPRMVPGLTVGWAGGGRPEADFEPLGDAWAELARRHPDVTFVMYGYESRTLALAVPEGQLALVQWAPIGLYPAGLRNIDIACCVLPETLCTKGKSPNKWLEHSLASTPAVVSPTVYGELVQDGHDAFVANTADEWVERIEQLIGSPELRQEIGRNARTAVLVNHALSEHWQRWPDAWRTIVESA